MAQHYGSLPTLVIAYQHHHRFAKVRDTLAVHDRPLTLRRKASELSEIFGVAWQQKI